MKCLNTWSYSLSFNTPGLNWSNVSDSDWNLHPGANWELMVWLMFKIQKLVSTILAALATVVQQVVTR